MTDGESHLLALQSRDLCALLRGPGRNIFFFIINLSNEEHTILDATWIKKIVELVSDFSVKSNSK